MSITKRKIKSTSVNQQTGEVHETLTTHTEHMYRRPVNGYKGVYMKKAMIFATLLATTTWAQTADSTATKKEEPVKKCFQEFHLLQTALA